MRFFQLCVIHKRKREIFCFCFLLFIQECYPGFSFSKSIAGTPATAGTTSNSNGQPATVGTISYSREERNSRNASNSRDDSNWNGINAKKTTSMLAATAEANNSKDPRGSCNQPASERTTATEGTLATSLTLSSALAQAAAATTRIAETQVTTETHLEISIGRRNISNSREISNNRDASNSRFTRGSRDTGKSSRDVGAGCIQFLNCNNNILVFIP